MARRGFLGRPFVQGASHIDIIGERVGENNEIDHVRGEARKNGVRLDDFQRYLMNKPFRIRAVTNS
jgi:uncharacterized protein YlxW (UPF0749 family)